jgi:DNA-binding CsgD family transcriptional regulator
VQPSGFADVAPLWETQRGDTSTSDASTTRRGRLGSAERPTAFSVGPLIGRDGELAQLAALLATVQDGGSAALVLRGEPGVGKSALLEVLIGSASGFQVVRAAGVEGEADLPYAGLQQLCRSMTDRIGALPKPQSEALHIAFGLSSGEAPDRYIVGLATLSLMSEVAAAQPVLCVVDDAQWLDPETVRALAFVARRLGADSVGLVFASREIVGELESVPELQLGGLSTSDSRTLLDSLLLGRLDDAIRDRLLAEAHGNPLALIELPRAVTAAEAAAGIVHRTRASLTARIEGSFRHQLEPLPADTRRLLVLAAAEPLGDPLLLLRGASQLGLTIEAADAAEEAGLFEIRERCSFRHPLVRSAVYGAATPSERRVVHGALAEASDPERDPDRRAWHGAQATSTPDEKVAAELERTAARAKARGGLAAAGTFLERAAMLTPDEGRRLERFLVAAELMYEAGALDSVEGLVRAIDAARLDEVQRARLERLEAEVFLSRGEPTTEKTTEMVLKLVAAAKRLQGRHSANAYTLDAMRYAFWSADPQTYKAVSHGLAEVPATESSAAGLLCRGWAQLLEHGYPAGTDLLRQAMISLREKPALEESDLPLLSFTEAATRTYWDIENWETLARRRIELARDVGALLGLPDALETWVDVMVAKGDLSAAATALAESEAISEAIGATCNYAASFYAWRFDEPEASARIARAARVWASRREHARAVAYNAAGRYEEALTAAERSCELHPTGTHGWALVDLVEAAVRCGEQDRARVALDQLKHRTRLVSTDWGLGLEARCAALVADDATVVEALYVEAVERLDRAGTRPDLARAHLLYGEWLRREGRRLDAREQLRTAYEMFSEMGIPGFAERARRELSATGETARKRTDDTRGDLTAQELQIAQLASEGLTNPEIGAKLFLSPRTIEWHLRRIYPKLGVSSRKELRVRLHPS